QQREMLLGAARSPSPRGLENLRLRGILETRRGSVLVRDHAGLKAFACLCNEAVKGHFEEVLSGVYPNGGEGKRQPPTGCEPKPDGDFITYAALAPVSGRRRFKLTAGASAFPFAGHDSPKGEVRAV